MSKILITGATGHLGNIVTEHLLQKTNPANVSVLVRSAEKAAGLKAKGASIAIGDYDDYASLLTAFTEIDKIFFISGSDLQHRAKQHENVVAAAKEAGVKHIVYTSFQRKNQTQTSPIEFVAKSHRHTEELLINSELVYTILQNTLYADMIPIFAGQQLLENKTIFLPAEQGKTAFALRSDFGEASANILLDETGLYNQKSIELTGSQALGWADIASFISEITGLSIEYTSPSLDNFSAVLTEKGVPAEYIGLFSSFNQAIAQGEFENVNNELELILGRKPITVAAYLQSVYGK